MCMCECLCVLPSGRCPLHAMLWVWSLHVNTLMPVFAFLWDMLVEKWKVIRTSDQISMGRLATPQRWSKRRHCEGNSLMRTIIKGEEKNLLFAHSHSFVAAHITFIPLLPELQSPHYSSINIHRLAVNIYSYSGPVCLSVCSVPAFLESNHKCYFFLVVHCCFVDGSAGRGRKRGSFSLKCDTGSCKVWQRRAASVYSPNSRTKPHLTGIMIHDL